MFSVERISQLEKSFKGLKMANSPKEQGLPWGRGKLEALREAMSPPRV